MKLQTLATILACLGTLSGPAMALDIGVGASLGGNASASSGEGSGLSLGLGADLGANISVGPDAIDSAGNIGSSLSANASAAASLTADDDLSVVISLIHTSTWTEDSLSSLTDVDATAYDVSAWINADNAAALEFALTDNAGEIEDLHAALTANAALDAWLEANNSSAEDVIAIGVAADGSLAVFTN
jgi:hypothetical protein